MVVERVESTCTTNGHVTLKCRFCLETRTEQLPLAKHDYAWATATHPTDTQAGTTEYRCSVCGKVQASKDLYRFSFDACDGQGDVLPRRK